ncbi:hypothetical protein HARCEL1_01635 [Halococcoides cellulosivorans]|uniref:Uncharacterized protein n=1 Tax=Halococcoides cellulosivorans TaxID=1679096 RepID=A0A2R4X4G6_9EURY|nr:hypothetical protein HARCEL1_01635 [Halococcoides cellulosivorans]
MAIGLALFVVLNVISYVWFPFLPWFEQRQAGEEIVSDQMDADTAIQEYRWFRRQYEDIQAQRAQVQNSYDELDRFYDIHGEDPETWSRQAETRHGRIQERITGNQNVLETLIADYNARSSDATRAVFKCHLPYQVDEQFAIRGPPGSDPADHPTDVDVEGDPIDPEQTPPSYDQCDGLPDRIES